MFAQRIDLGQKLAETLPFVLTSPNATPPHQIVLAFLVGVLFDVSILSPDDNLRRPSIRLEIESKLTRVLACDQRLPSVKEQ